MIKPTIGRQVWYQPALVMENDKRKPQPYPATISYVHTDRVVNVGGFTNAGHPFHDTGVILLQDDDKEPDWVAYAQWMPFQKGQAAKTEALEEELNRKDKE